jgi:ABC-2 type transport system permease protein
MLVILVIMMALTGVAVEPTWRMGGEGLLVLSITLLGLCGFGYALAGLTLMFKRVAGLVGLFNLAMLLLMGFGGTLGSELTHAGTSAVLPLVLGSHLIYRAVSSVTEGPALSEIGLLAGNSLAYLLVGIWAFRRAEYHTRRRGSLGQF